MRARTVLPIAALVLLTFVGCGGGGGDSSTTTNASTDSTEAAAPRPSPASVKPEKREPDKPVAEQSAAKAGSGGHAKQPSKSTTSTNPSPLPNQGTDAVAPSVPTTKGGDNSIQTYGVEGESSQRIAATRLLGSYLGAQAAGDWEAACAELSTVVQRQLAIAMQGESSATSKGCAGAMGSALEANPQIQSESAARIQVLSYRVKGPQAFLIYRDGAGKAFNMPLRSEGGKWRIGALSGIELAL